jgi:hypothetical protein
VIFRLEPPSADDPLDEVKEPVDVPDDPLEAPDEVLAPDDALVAPDEELAPDDPLVAPDEELAPDDPLVAPDEEPLVPPGAPLVPGPEELQLPRAINIAAPIEPPSHPRILIHPPSCPCPLG